MQRNDFDTWGPCTAAEAEALAAGMWQAERHGRDVQGDHGTWEWIAEPEAWEVEPHHMVEAAEVRHG